MSAKQIGPVRQAWYQWKALRLPWRKRFLVGLDLQGNTYWEFRLTRGDPELSPDARYRRIVKYPRSTHYSEVKVPPQWHQWLRYQRRRAPSLAEQAEDVARQERVKLLAAEADARWEAKPGYLDPPPPPPPPPPPSSAEAAPGGSEKSQPVPPLDTGYRQQQQPQEQEQEQERAAQESSSTPDERRRQTTDAQQQSSRFAAGKGKDDPWKRARPSAPGETWQPEAWTPPAAKKR
ncbi:Superoxide dismutase [Mn], mitochondrial [Hypoxylon texense]